MIKINNHTSYLRLNHYKIFAMNDLVTGISIYKNPSGDGS